MMTRVLCIFLVHSVSGGRPAEGDVYATTAY